MNFGSGNISYAGDSYCYADNLRLQKSSHNVISILNMNIIS